MEFARMSREQLITYCRNLYAKKGIAAFSYPALKAIPKLYLHLYENNLPQKTLLKALGLEGEYKEYRIGQPFKYGGTTRIRWTWTRLTERALAVKAKEGHLPPAQWFQQNGETAFVNALYSLGYTWDQLQEAVGDFSNSNFVQSRNGMRWLSHAEASLSNFLYARGIQQKKGQRYDAVYAENAQSKYAIYDLHFLGANGKWFDVEVWGDRPNGHDEVKYARVRKAKESFNLSNENFLGIHYSDCYDERKLESLLQPAIGVVIPFQFDKPTDHLVHSTHWSNADELLEFCQNLASKMPNGEFPAEDWLRKRGRWENREGETFNTLSVYIKLWLGGIRNLRKLIGQSDVSTKKWDKASALNAYRAFYEKHGFTPHQVRQMYRTKRGQSIAEEVAKEAVNLSYAIAKYAGGASEVNRSLGIQLKRRANTSA